MDTTGIASFLIMNIKECSHLSLPEKKKLRRLPKIENRKKKKKGAAFILQNE
jgi:hypothetical protein